MTRSQSPPTFTGGSQIDIVLTWFANSDARKAFENDPEFKKTSEIRDKAVKLVSVTGKSVFGD